MTPDLSIAPFPSIHQTTSYENQSTCKYKETFFLLPYFDRIPFTPRTPSYYQNLKKYSHF